VTFAAGDAGARKAHMISPLASLTLDWLHIIVLLGAIQGVFLAGALASKRRNRTAKRHV